MKTASILLYLGHKLMNAPEHFIKEMDVLREHLEKELPECVILRFLGTKFGTRADVFEKDITTNVASCDLFVCIADMESTGLGIEIGAALWKYAKPILVLYKTDVKISRLIGGAIDYHPDQMIERTINGPADAALAIRETIKMFRIGARSRLRVSGWKS